MMSHWLEDAENRQNRSRHRSGTLKKRIEDKKRMISENLEANKDIFYDFIQTMHDLVKRVNELPEDLRDSFKKISVFSKKTKLDNKLHYYSSSRRELKHNFFSFKWLKPIHYKHIRVFYIYVSKQTGYVTFEFKENMLERKRLSSGHSPKDEDEKSENDKNRMHVIFRYPMKNLSKKTGLQIIDWLAFKNHLHDLQIWSEIPIEEKSFF
jgi:flagellar biosynthesis regulator FlaF